MRKPKAGGSGVKKAGPVRTTMGNAMRVKGRGKSGRSKGRC